MKILLVDYKGKWQVPHDEDFVDEEDLPYVVGETTKEELIKNKENHLEACRYYGIPAYVGKDKELKDIFG